MYNCMGHIIVMGDINCRTGTDNDFIDQESSQCDVGAIPYTIDDAIVAGDVSILKHRRSEDKIVHENGKELLNLCVGNNLCIVNGRIGEYPDGSFTCHTARGKSVVDYFIVNTEQLRDVAKFKVQANNPLSNHNCITMDIKFTSPTITSTSHQRSMNTFYRWSSEIKDEYREQINRDNVQEQFAHVIANINRAECGSELNAAVKSINDIFLCCAEPYKCQSKKSTMQICPRQSARWYDDECHKLRATHNSHRNRFRKSKDERDKTNRDEAKSDYVALCKKK